MNSFSSNVFRPMSVCLAIRTGIYHSYLNSCVDFTSPVDNAYLWFIIPQLLNGLSSLLVSWNDCKTLGYHVRSLTYKSWMERYKQRSKQSIQHQKGSESNCRTKVVKTVEQTNACHYHNSVISPTLQRIFILMHIHRIL